MALLKEAECLRKVPMFTKLDASKVKLLAFTSDLLIFEDGEVLFQEGDTADCAYVIINGQVDILAPTNAGGVVVGSLGENQLFGELAVLTNSPRTATLRARGRLEALRIAKEVFLKLVTQNPEVALDVMRQLSEKLTLSHRQVETLQSELHRRKPVQRS